MIGLDSVIGLEDGRQPVPSTLDVPFRKICRLRILGPDNKVRTGTGWFAGPRTIVTAGHCITASEMGGAAVNITVAPAFDEGVEPYGNQLSTSYETTNLWKDDRNPDFDYGCIHLAREFTPRPGYFSFDDPPAGTLMDLEVHVCGYPTDTHRSTQYHHSDVVLSVGDHRIFYAVDTNPGESGAPIWMVDANGIAVVVGIHAYSEDETPPDLHIEANSGPRITSEVRSIIQGWVQADA
jgi:V8-like Glu-specific endopeptidase